MFGRDQIPNLLNESTVLFIFIKVCDKFYVRVNASGCSCSLPWQRSPQAAVGQQELVHRDMSSLVVGGIRTRGSEMSGASAAVLMPTSAHQRSSKSFSDNLV